MKFTITTNNSMRGIFKLMSKNRDKKRYFICPICKKRHDNIPKTKGLEVVIVLCECGCGSIIQVENGYYIPSEGGTEIYNC